MNPKTNSIELAIICVVFLLLSLWGIVWGISSGLLTSGIDGIMLLAICLMMGGIFALQLLLTARNAGWVKFPTRKSSVAAAAPAKPVGADKTRAFSPPETVERGK